MECVLRVITLDVRVLGCIFLVRDKQLKITVMKKLIIILIVFVCSNNFAATKKSKKESSLKHSYEEYIDLYGGNDTSRAIIELFFDKREFSAGGKMSFLPLSLGIALVVPPIGIGLMGLSTPLFISGIVTRKRYNHKNLMVVLEQYNKDGKLPKRIKKQIKLILIAEHDEQRDGFTSSIKRTLRSVEIKSAKKNTILVVN